MRPTTERDVVLRRYVRPEILAESPDVASVEARALQLAEQVPVPTPSLLALDATGDHTEAPTLATTLLDGRPVWETQWASKWVSQAVDAMITLHDIDTSEVDLSPLTTYAQRSYDPPTVDERRGPVGTGRRVVRTSGTGLGCRVRPP